MCVCVYWSNQIPVACFTAKLQQSDNVGVSVNGGLLYVLQHYKLAIVLAGHQGITHVLHRMTTGFGPLFRGSKFS